MFIDVVSVSDVGPRLDFVPDKVVVDADSVSDVGLRLVPDEVVVTADSTGCPKKNGPMFSMAVTPTK